MPKALGLVALLVAVPLAARGDASPAALTDVQRAAIDMALVAYERVRSALARDGFVDAASEARALEAACRRAGDLAPASYQREIERLIVASASLSRAPANRPRALRRAFGEVSRTVIALLAAHRSLVGSRRVFECPATFTYRKWVQLDERPSNPYLGARMPGCGSPSEWRE